ncbi:hypothetical protein [Frigoribacterium sp. UYMn621]|uniref:hypothetical protein n=1 Tax=Frigoribacterium sp. UYMn621 TaxID=3156343 RepID=UPI003392BE08
MVIAFSAQQFGLLLFGFLVFLVGCWMFGRLIRRGRQASFSKKSASQESDFMN